MRRCRWRAARGAARGKQRSASSGSSGIRAQDGDGRVSVIAPTWLAGERGKEPAVGGCRDGGGDFSPPPDRRSRWTWSLARCRPGAPISSERGFTIVVQCSVLHSTTYHLGHIRRCFFPFSFALACMHDCTPLLSASHGHCIFFSPGMSGVCRLRNQRPAACAAARRASCFFRRLASGRPGEPWDSNKLWGPALAALHWECGGRMRWRSKRLRWRACGAVRRLPLRVFAWVLRGSDGVILGGQGAVWSPWARQSCSSPTAIGPSLALTGCQAPVAPSPKS